MQIGGLGLSFIQRFTDDNHDRTIQIIGQPSFINQSNYTAKRWTPLKEEAFTSSLTTPLPLDLADIGIELKELFLTDPVPH